LLRPLVRSRLCMRSVSLTLRTCASSGRRTRSRSDGCIPRTRSIMLSSSWPSSTVLVSYSSRQIERDMADCGAHHLGLLCCTGRFRVVDGGNPPTGAAEASVLARVCPWLRPPLVLLADVTYSSDSRCLCPYRSPELAVAAAGTAREAMRRRLYNQQLSRVRQKVEHSFSRLKHTFRQLQAQWPMPLSRLPATFRAAALLTNWLHRTRGL
jgi:hypothetical protein